MDYAIRPMQLEDVPQVTEIDRESFPTLQPPTAFKRELLHNKIARYLVAWEVEEEGKNEVTTGEDHTPTPGSRLDRVISGMKHLFSTPPTTKQRIVGFTGLWFMADEAHLTTIAVREAYRRWGIGELLLISAIDAAVERNAQFITLEVRSSNLTAQALYKKYGFARTRVRRGYYTDNRENAVIMATERITSASFQSNFQRLKRLHSQRWGWK